MNTNSVLQFSKTLGAAPRNLLPNKITEFDLDSFKNLCVNYKFSGTKRLKTYQVNKKLKAEFTKL